MIKRYTIIVTLAVLAFLARPTQVFACDSWSLSCLLGMDDIADRDAQRRETENAQNTQAQIRQTEINAQRDQALRQADNALHIQVLQGQVTVEQARIQMEAYKALLENNTQTQNAVITGQSAQNIAAIQAAAQVSIVGVQESGQTVRERLMFESIRGIVIFAGLLLASLIVIVIAVVILRFRRSPGMIQAPTWPKRTVSEQEVYLYPTPVQTRQSEIVTTNNNNNI